MHILLAAIASAIISSSAFLSLGMMEHVNGSGWLEMSQLLLFTVSWRETVPT
jgi:hypothetical protein